MRPRRISRGGRAFTGLSRQCRVRDMRTRDKLVIVRADALDDTLDLVERALAVPGLDPALADALRGAIAEVRAHSTIEP
jgi:hypothetical protein